MPDDLEIVERVRSGQIDAYSELIERYQGAVFCMIRGMITNHSDHEDVAQDVFVRAFEQLERYDSGRGAFSTWLMTLARNTCFNALKKNRVPTVSSLPEPADASSTANQEADTREWFAHLDATLATLPLAQRSAWVLSQFVGLPYSEVAAIEGIEIGTVKSRIGRARHSLRAQLHHSAEHAT
jgi:RNA polymerase sigma-70 factor (ECF subfamily)